MSTHALNHGPLFSVILPTRDRAEMLPRAVSSVLSQSLQDFELIIIDDGSAKLCDDLPRDARIRILRNASSSGVAHARNLGIQAAHGRYISFLDDDDEYLPSFLRMTHARLRDSPDEIGISWCGVTFIDDAITPGASSVSRTRTFGEYNSRQSLLEDFLTIGTGFGVTIKSDCLNKVGLFNEALKVSSDSDMFIRILAKGFTPTVLPGVHLVLRRDHHGPRLQSLSTLQERIRTWEWFLSEYSEFLDENPTLKRRFLNYIDSLKKKLEPSRNHVKSHRGRDRIVRFFWGLLKAPGLRRS
jgi:glycosyltransferase involved in cell wall biosynthesis